MYKITTQDSTLLTDQLCFIREVYPGGYVVTTEDKAQGLAHQGNFYLFADGVSYSGQDTGEVFADVATDLSKGEAAQADTEQALVEEDQLLDMRLADIETALVELDQRTGGI